MKRVKATPTTKKISQGGKYEPNTSILGACPPAGVQPDSNNGKKHHLGGTFWSNIKLLISGCASRVYRGQAYWRQVVLNRPVLRLEPWPRYGWQIDFERERSDPWSTWSLWLTVLFNSTTPADRNKDRIHYHPPNLVLWRQICDHSYLLYAAHA